VTAVDVVSQLVEEIALVWDALAPKVPEVVVRIADG